MSIGISGEIGRPSLIGVIRKIYLAEATGVLEVTQADRKRRFFFRNGELFLPSSHFLGQRLGELLELERELARSRRAGTSAVSDPLRLAREEQEREPQKSALARKQLQELVTRIVDVLVEWQSGRYELLAAESESQPDLVGPLPTAYLVMEGAIRDLKPEEGLESIGGPHTVVVADTGSRLLLSPYGIDTDEMFILTRAETPTAVGELLRQLPGPREDGIARIIRLKSVDLLRISVPPSEESGGEGFEQRHSSSMTERFLLRFASQLPPEDEPASEEEIANITKLIQRFAGFDNYELLGVKPDSDTDDIHDAYQVLAKKIHPGNAQRLDMVRAMPALALLFERATAAYLTLADPERRAEYNTEAGIEIHHNPVSGERSRERQQLALVNAKRAERLLETGEYHFALELVRQAVRADPQAEYVALLGRIQRRNPHWVPDAIANYKQAIRMAPKVAKYRFELAELLEESGSLDRARVHYQAALQLAPHDGHTMDALERVRSGKSRGENEERSFIGRIKELWADSEVD